MESLAFVLLLLVTSLRGSDAIFKTHISNGVTDDENPVPFNLHTVKIFSRESTSTLKAFPLNRRLVDKNFNQFLISGLLMLWFHNRLLLDYNRWALCWWIFHFRCLHRFKLLLTRVNIFNDFNLLQEMLPMTWITLWGLPNFLYILIFLIPMKLSTI